MDSLSTEAEAAATAVSADASLPNHPQGAASSFDSQQQHDEAAATWSNLILTHLCDHPYQNVVLALIVARLLHILVVAFGFRKTATRQQPPDTASSSRDNDGSNKHHYDRRLHSRLLKEPLPDDLELNEEVIIDKTTTAAIEHVVGEYSQKVGDDDDDEQLGDARTDDKTTPSIGDSTPSNISSGINVLKGNSADARRSFVTENPWATSSTAGPSHDTTASRHAATSAPLSQTAFPITSNVNNISSHNHTCLSAFHHWFDVEASLFHVYERGRTDHDVVPPYNPSSRRGTVKIALQVVNQTSRTRITAYWVDYQGRRVDKGSFGPGQLWEQTTWIDHPWVFANGHDDVLLHYIPYRVVPTTSQEPTTDPTNAACGMHRFRIKDPSPNDAVFRCQIDDSILPFPAAYYFATPEFALDKTLLHCYRMDYHGWSTLITYLSKIVQHPDVYKYRQIRTANKHFASDIWMTPAKGLLLALGFVERGAYVELGDTAGALSGERVQNVSMLLYHIEQWQRYAESGVMLLEQPEGADGFGQAGYGRAGQMNL